MRNREVILAAQEMFCQNIAGECAMKKFSLDGSLTNKL